MLVNCCSLGVKVGLTSETIVVECLSQNLYPNLGNFTNKIYKLMSITDFSAFSFSLSLSLSLSLCTFEAHGRSSFPHSKLGFSSVVVEWFQHRRSCLISFYISCEESPSGCSLDCSKSCIFVMLYSNH